MSRVKLVMILTKLSKVKVGWLSERDSGVAGGSFLGRRRKIVERRQEGVGVVRRLPEIASVAIVGVEFVEKC